MTLIRMKSIFIIIVTFLISFGINSQSIELDDVTNAYDLSGKWKFISFDHPDYSNPDFDDSNWQDILVPGLWRRQSFADAPTGWYRNQIFIKENWEGKNISILSPSFIDAHEFFFNGVKIGGEGKIDSSGKCLVNNSKYNIHHIPESTIRINSLNTIAIRVCNYSGFAGASGEMVIGERKKISEKFYKSMVWNVSIGLVFLFVSIYHLILFLGSRKDLSYLYFSVACLLSSCLTLGYFRFTYWMFDSYWFHFYFFNSGFGMMVLFLVLFVHSFFEHKIPVWIRFLNYLVLIIYALFLFSSASTILFKFYVRIGQPLMMLVGIPYAASCSYVIIKAVKDKKSGSRIIGAGLIFLLAAFATGLLLYFNLIHFINLMPESFLTFTLCIAIALSAKFYGINEQLLLLQRNHSEELERKIKERTIDLEDAKKTAEIETGIAWIAQRESQEEKEKTEKLLKEIQKDMLTAQKIQQNILPHNLDQIKKLKISTLYKPVSSVGGDFYDIEEIRPGLVRAFIADATGHGVQAALITMAIKSEYESVKDMLNSPARILKFLNDNFSNKYKSLSIYFTAFIIDIDTIYDRITYSSAGHIPQVLINEDKVQILTHRGNIIGMIPDVEYDQEECEFKSGRLFLFTDGIEEEFNEAQEQFGEERVLEILEKEKDKPLQTSIDSLYKAMNQFIDTARVRDDITLIGIEYKK